MKDAAGTWALVVGIDAYEHFRPLHGAAADAVRAVRWLRALGVPDGQILLNAAPSAATKPEVDDLGLPVRGTTLAAVTESFDALLANEAGGARLFVFLSGHGLYDPGGHRMFLTSESSPKMPRNVAVDLYADVLRGLPYRRQYLVLDACQSPTNDPLERSKYVPGSWNGAPANPARADVAQWLCLAAGAGELAFEPGGKSLFTTALLEALDLDKPDGGCVGVDLTTGELVLDLARAVKVVAQRVSHQGVHQNPDIRPLGDGPANVPVPVVRIGTRPTTTVRIDVAPGGAVANVERIKLESDDFDWKVAFPEPPPLVCPISAVLPVDMRVSVRAVVAAPPRPPGQEFVTTADDTEVVFDLSDPGAGPVAVTTVAPHGGRVSGMTAEAYEAVERLTERAGAAFEHHESGPVLLDFDREDSASVELALRVADAVNEGTEAAYRAVVTGVDTAAVRTALSVAVKDPAALAGLRAGDPVVSVGDVEISPGTLYASPEVEVEPGQVTVAVTLPWGGWSTTVRAREGATTKVALPETVGLPPLRVRALGPGGDRPPQERSLVMLDASKPRPGQAKRGTSPWLGTTWSFARSATRWRTVARVRLHLFGDVRLPLSESGAVGVLGGDAPRAEPLSRDPSVEWDALVASGRIEDVPAEAARNLTDRKWFEPLLGVAGAYACYAQHQLDYLDVVLGNLARIDPDIPDLVLLEAAADSAVERHRPEVAERLGALTRRRVSVPVFRWGLTVGMTGALHYDVPALVDRLSAVGSRLVPTSIWTMWREE